MAGPVEIHLTDELTQQIVKRAVELNISSSEFIRHAVRNEISRFDRRHETRRIETLVQSVTNS